MTRESERRVVVTGLGAVSAWGWGVEPLWSGLCSNATAIGTFDRFDHQRFPTHVAGQVPDPPPGLAGGFRDWSKLSLADRFAVAAASEALAQAGQPTDLSPLGAGVFFGSSTGGMLEGEELYRKFGVLSTRRISLAAFASQPVNSPGDAVARAVRATGPVQTFSTACTSAALAIGAAFESVRQAQLELAIAGGSDCLCHVTFGGFNALRAVDARPCLPFRAERAGLSLGEGSAALVLEPLDAALSRGAVPLAELLGAGTSADAYHMTAPDPSGAGAALALAAALQDSGDDPSCVDFVNAHGTGTELNDLAEYHALEKIFGERARDIPITSTKGSVGHLLGSAGAIEAVATVQCLRHQRVHPTPGPGEIDPRMRLNLIRGLPATGMRLEVGASVNLGFGGCNGALLFRRWVAA